LQKVARMYDEEQLDEGSAFGTVSPTGHAPQVLSSFATSHEVKPDYSMGGLGPDLAFAPATTDNLVAAVGHYADGVNYADGPGADREARQYQRHELAQWETKVGDKATDAQRSAARIGVSGDGAAPVAYDTEVGDLTTAESRVETLNMLTQNRDPNDPNAPKDGRDNYECGAASIVGGSIYSGGRDGVSQLLNDVHADLKPGDADYEKIEELQKKLRSGEQLSVGDLQSVQTYLYDDMKHTDEKKSDDQIHEDAENGSKDAFLSGKDVAGFMSRHPDVAASFAKNHVSLSGIDTTGAGAVNHMVTKFGDGKGNDVAVYDPWKKTGAEGQIINGEDDTRGLGNLDPKLSDYETTFHKDMKFE
jgi:hypothetical protein